MKLQVVHASGGSDEAGVLNVAIERDEAAMTVSVEVVVAENASLQLVDGSTVDDLSLIHI